MYNYILSKIPKANSKEKFRCISKIHKYMNEDVHSEQLVLLSSKRLNKSLEYYERFKEHQSITNLMIQREDFKLLHAFNKEAKIDSYDKMEQITYSIFVFGKLRSEMINDNNKEETIFRKIRSDMYLALNTGNPKFISSYVNFAPMRFPTLRNRDCLDWYYERYDDMEGIVKGCILGDSLENIKYILESKTISQRTLFEALEFSYWHNKTDFINVIEEYIKNHNIPHYGDHLRLVNSFVIGQNPEMIKRNLKTIRSIPKNRIPFRTYLHSVKNEYLPRVLRYLFIEVMY